MNFTVLYAFGIALFAAVGGMVEGVPAAKLAVMIALMFVMVVELVRYGLRYEKRLHGKGGGHA